MISSGCDRCVADWCAVAAIPTHGDRFGVDRIIARILESKCDRAGRMIAARKDSGIGHGLAITNGDGAAGGGGDGWTGRTNYNCLTRIVILGCSVVVRISTVGGIPLIGARHRSCTRQRISGRSGIGSIAGHGYRFRVHGSAVVYKRKCDCSRRAIAG